MIHACGCGDQIAVRSLDDIAEFLSTARSNAKHVSFREIRRHIKDARQKKGIPEAPPSVATIHGYFQRGRKRINVETVREIGAALGLDKDALRWLERECRLIVDGIHRSMAVPTATEVPAPTWCFRGRDSQREQARRYIADNRAAGRSTVIAVHGPAGVGKTELARRICADLAQSGETYAHALSVDLRGYHATEPPADSAAVLRGFLKRLGLKAQQVESLTRARFADEYSAMLRPKGAVVVLDNAESAAQVAPLIPRHGTNIVIITSRRAIDVPGVQRIDLDVLDREDAASLLRSYDPVDRIDADSQRTRTLVDLCQQLPLELTVVGNALQDKPEWTLADHVARMRGLPIHQASHHALLASYRVLPAPAKRLFRLLSIYPGRAIDLDAAAALAGQPVRDTAALLSTLHDESLLKRDNCSRYLFYATVRSFARRMAVEEEAASDQYRALQRLRDQKAAQARIRHRDRRNVALPRARMDAAALIYRGELIDRQGRCNCAVNKVRLTV